MELAEAVGANPRIRRRLRRSSAIRCGRRCGWGWACRAPSKKQARSVALCSKLADSKRRGRGVSVRYAEKEKGEMDGRMDHASLGCSLHEMGYCLSRTGQYAEARVTYERAVAEHEKGDVDGRVDHASVGRSLHHVGYGLSSTGQYAEAGQWFERAVAEKENGDVERSRGPPERGAQPASCWRCLARTGQNAEARTWFERAVAEKEKGDVEGRIDHGAWAAACIRWATACGVQGGIRKLDSGLNAQ